jgi:hypothetical protein
MSDLMITVVAITEIRPSGLKLWLGFEGQDERGLYMSTFSPL